MTWLWPMLWSGPAWLLSGCLMSPGTHFTQWTRANSLISTPLSTVSISVNDINNKTFSPYQARGEGLQCAPAGVGHSHIWWAESPSDCQCPAAQWWRPVWCLTLWQRKRRCETCVVLFLISLIIQSSILITCCTFVVGPCDLQTQTIHYPSRTNLVKLVFSDDVHNWTVLDWSELFSIRFF